MALCAKTDLVAISEFSPHAAPSCLVPSCRYLLHLLSSHVSLYTLRPCCRFPSMLSSWARDLSPSYGSPFGLTRPTPSLVLSSHMVRDRPSRCLRQQVRRPRCPSCGKQFADILCHLNHRHSKCADWFNAASPHHHHWSPSPHFEHPLDSAHHHEDPLDGPTDSPTLEGASSAPQPPPHQPRLQCVQFPGAAKVYGRAKTFMDKFHDDKYSEFRTSNVHYPFSGKAEWELGSFLLSSGLLMRKIDEFLQLQMVSQTSYFVRKAC